MTEAETLPAINPDRGESVTGTITGEEIVDILTEAFHSDINLSDFSGEGHPVNIVLRVLENDERFYIDDDHSRPELYEWAQDNEWHIENQAWYTWRELSGMDKIGGVRESEFLDRYYIRQHTRKEKFSGTNGRTRKGHTARVW